MTNQQTALITGASRGLGLALARQLAQQGWALVIDARGAEALEHARTELAEQTQVVALAGDVRDVAHRRALGEAAAQLGGLDVLVNNASVLGPSPQPSLLEYPLDVLEDVYRANVIAPLGMVQALHQQLKPGARILNVTSDAGVEAYPGWGGYGSSKAALDQMSAILAAENPDLRVYWVDPGDMRTQMHQDAFPGEDISDRPLPDVSVPGLIALILGDYPSGRYVAREIGALANDELSSNSVSEMRVVLTVDDLDRTLALYRDGLGLPVQETWTSPDDHGHGVLVRAGSATLELIDRAEAAYIDQVEVGQRSAGPLRLAFNVPDAAATARALQQHGATPITGLIHTPWRHLNQRLLVGTGMQLTVFQPVSEESMPADQEEELDVAR